MDGTKGARLRAARGTQQPLSRDAKHTRGRALTPSRGCSRMRASAQAQAQAQRVCAQERTLTHALALVLLRARARKSTSASACVSVRSCAHTRCACACACALALMREHPRDGVSARPRVCFASRERGCWVPRAARSLAPFVPSTSASPGTRCAGFTHTEHYHTCGELGYLILVNDQREHPSSSPPLMFLSTSRSVGKQLM